MTPGNLILLTLISFYISSVDVFLLWPQFTVLQITASFSVPVEIPKRKMYFDWGFQFNYDLPYNGSNFWNTPVWPGHTRRSIDADIYRKYAPNLETHPNDLTAGEFYMAMENLLESYGYHETCLLKSVCEISRHPFDEEKGNLLTETITFVLSPSAHRAFGSDEIFYKEAYEDAEFLGKNGTDCKLLYPNCKKGFLDIISKVVFDN